jgi:hypothetical protein
MPRGPPPRDLLAVASQGQVALILSPPTLRFALGRLWLSNGLTGQRYRLTTIWTSPGIKLFCRDSPHAPSTLGGSE